MDSLEQKIRGILEDLVENYYSGKDVDSAIKMILALLQPQQPEGELVPCPKQLRNCNSAERVWEDAAEAQLAYDKATMVKLPSYDEAKEIILELICTPGEQKIAKLLKLLKEQGEQKPW